MESSGVWGRDKLELVDGELWSKLGKTRPHVNTATALRNSLGQVYGEQFVNCNAPINVAKQDNPINEPEPDLIVLREPSRTYSANPEPTQLRLAVEVSDFTIAFDSGPKAALYARAGIAEYWIADVAKHRLIVHRQPAEGEYRLISIHAAGDEVTPLDMASGIRVADVFAG